MKVDIVIVNWNSGYLLEKCVQSILNSSNVLMLHKIIIVDNNSSDNSLKNIIGNDKILVINNDRNLGFSMACNQGFKRSSAPYILLLNPDTQLFDDTLEKCVLFMKERSDIDILGCTLLDDHGRVTTSCARFPKPLFYLYRSFGLTNLFPTLFTPPDLMTDWDHKGSRFVDQVMGAFMFFRNELFKKIGYFDERFFVYFEELDFSNRLHQAGGRSYYNTDIKAIHSGLGTTKSVKAFSIFLYLQSKLKYSKKYFSNFGYGIVFFSTLFIEPISRIILLIINRKSSEVKFVLKAYALLIGSFFKKADDTKTT